MLKFKKMIMVTLILCSVLFVNSGYVWAATSTTTATKDNWPSTGFASANVAYGDQLYLSFPAILKYADITNAVINYDTTGRYISYLRFGVNTEPYVRYVSSSTTLLTLNYDNTSGNAYRVGTDTLNPYYYQYAADYGFQIYIGGPLSTNFELAKLYNSDWSLTLTYNEAPLVSGVGATSRDINLSLKAMTDGTSGTYKIYRNEILIHSFAYNAFITSFTDTNLNPNTSYSYKLVDPKGRTSAIKSIATLGDIPSAPTISNITQTTLSLTNYKNNNPSTTKYEIYRRDLTLNIAEVMITSTAGASYNDSGLIPGHQYSYRLKAVQTNGIISNFSSYSNPIMISPTPIISHSIGEGAWHKTEGRGSVLLNWPSTPNTNGYAVSVYDGYEYREYDVGNTTSWDSSIWNIYPSEASLDAYSNNTVITNIFNLVKGGLDIRDNPNKLYLKTSGTIYNNNTDYIFRVRAYNNTGTSPTSPVSITLPNRTDNFAPDVENIILNDGIVRTGNTKVKVAVSTKDLGVQNHTVELNDDYSGISLLHVSNDNFSTYSTIQWTNVGEQEGMQTFYWNIAPGEGTKSIYVRAIDRAGNVGNPKAASIFLKDDNSSPTVSMTINDGAEYTTNPKVNIILNAFDDLTGITELEMRFSFDGVVWTTWSNFAFVKDITLPSTETGIKRVFVQVRDGAGNVSIASDQIKYMSEIEVMQDKIIQRSESDTVAPIIDAFMLLHGASATSSNYATVELSIYDNNSDFSNLKVQ